MEEGTLSYSRWSGIGVQSPEERGKEGLRGVVSIEH